MSSYFINLLEQEDIRFDQILTDNPYLAKEWNILCIEGDLTSFFHKQKKIKTWLLILDQLNLQDVAPFVDLCFEKYYIIDARTWVSSFGKKISQEVNYLDSLVGNAIFPFDENYFIQALKSGTSSVIFLTDQEVPENIYASHTEEQLQIVDKALVEQPQFISLLSPENPSLFLIGTGNHLEELIKLSQFLSLHEQKIALGVIGNFSVIKSLEFQQKFLSVKKIWILIDHTPTNFFSKFFSTNKEITLITPKYQQLTSISPDWAFTQTEFDAEALLKRVVEWVE